MNCHPEPLALKKRQKVRAAWISFAGRIAAQLIGAAATVGLGVVVLGNRMAPVASPTVVATAAPSVLVAKPFRTQQGTVIVMVPLDRYDEVTAETVTTVSRAFATNLSPFADTSGQPQPGTPILTAANDH